VPRHARRADLEKGDDERKNSLPEKFKATSVFVRLSVKPHSSFQM